jgi:hypothetical protein
MEAHILREWVLWNHAAGVQHFVIMDNNDANPNGMRDDLDEALSPFSKDLVTILKFPRDVMNNIDLAPLYGFNRSDFESLDILQENPLKQRCYDIYRSRSKWIAFIDVDEVFVPIQEGLSLPNFLSQAPFSIDEFIGGVGFLWRISHYSGFFSSQSQSLSNFDLCEDHATNKHIKPIVRGATRSLLPVMRIFNAHFLAYEAGYRCVLEGTLVSEGCSDQDLHKFVLNETWQRPKSVYFQLNHYALRSVSEYLVKFLHGTYMGEKLQSEHHLRHLAGYSGFSSCRRVQDISTQRSATVVRSFKKLLNIEDSVPPSLQSMSISQSVRNWSPPLGEFFDALKDKKSWDENYYLQVNQNKSECYPTSQLDGLLTFWGANRASFSNGGPCKVRFV